MKKSISSLVLVAILVFFSSSPSFAQEITGPYAKVALGIDYLDGYDFQSSNGNSYISSDVDFDLGHVALLAGGFRFNESFALELEYATRKHGIDSVSVINSNLVDKGDMKSKSIMLNAIYYITAFEYVNPYVGLGLGLITDLKQDLEIENYGGRHSSRGDAFAFQGLVGLEVPVNPEFRFFFEGRVMTGSSPDVENSVSSYNVAYDSLSVLGGLVYIFPVE